ncbi:hypothetical protein Lal_00048784 [Lupinus albus]|nr:hypothetical protein Lal_00048784 [Lupinus albus]
MQKSTMSVVQLVGALMLGIGPLTIFKYIPKYYNVVKVNQSGYNACDAKNAIAVYKSGNDMVTLQSGVHYFICSVGDDCQKHGMSVVIQVL